MSYNGFGHLFRVTTWGESHGPAIGAVVDGCPPAIPLDAPRDIQPSMDRRKPGGSKYVTQRQEGDEVEILSGVFEGKTTGTPISLIIYNKDQRSKDYSEISQTYRPGHADFTYDQKYGFRDYRGGGRSSARETASRVAAGAVAKAVLKSFYPDLNITASMVQMGQDKARDSNYDMAQIDKNPFFCADADAAERWGKQLDSLRKEGNSVGAIIECRVTHMPRGIGSPIYQKLDNLIANGMMTINAVKGVEIGDGFAAATYTGTQNADEIMCNTDGDIHFKSNHAGGILGGISTGQDLVFRTAIKPTSSILVSKETITRRGEKHDIVTKGRHDPCVGIRAVPVIEAMTACILLDCVLMHRAQTGRLSGLTFEELITYEG
ncbi:MAG: chorismate synthase [Pseudomonadota bacterium]